MITLHKNLKRNWIELHFSSMAEINEPELKAQGFRWHGNKLRWVIDNSEQNRIKAVRYYRQIINGKEKQKRENEARARREFERKERLAPYEQEFKKDSYSIMQYLQNHSFGDTVFEGDGTYRCIDDNGVMIIIKVNNNKPEVLVTFTSQQYRIKETYLAQKVAEILINYVDIKRSYVDTRRSYVDISKEREY